MALGWFVRVFARAWAWGPNPSGWGSPHEGEAILTKGSSDTVRNGYVCHDRAAVDRPPAGVALLVQSRTE